MTRLDVAYDDHTGVLDIDQIAENVKLQHSISCMCYWEVMHSSKGTVCQIGSPKSKNLCS
ncbi:MAG: replication initiation factor domain-containing protein [Oscillospiraceae bacterium]|nr:replication initiation factor domain-containing protein [Oscillospiraceae bacterium]